MKTVFLLVRPDGATLGAFTTPESAAVYGADTDPGTAWQIVEVPWLDDYQVASARSPEDVAEPEIVDGSQPTRERADHPA